MLTFCFWHIPAIWGHERIHAGEFAQIAAAEATVSSCLLASVVVDGHDGWLTCRLVGRRGRVQNGGVILNNALCCLFGRSHFWNNFLWYVVYPKKKMWNEEAKNININGYIYISKKKKGINFNLNKRGGWGGGGGGG